MAHRSAFHFSMLSRCPWRMGIVSADLLDFQSQQFGESTPVLSATIVLSMPNDSKLSNVPTGRQQVALIRRFADEWWRQGAPGAGGEWLP